VKNSEKTTFHKFGVGVILLRKNTILLGKRKGPRNPDTYGLPGGFLEYSETLEICAKREVFEETGLKDIDVFSLFLIRWNGNKEQYVDAIFGAKCEYGTPLVRESERVVSWEWYKLTDLPSPLYTPTKLALDQYNRHGRFLKLRMQLIKWIYPRKEIILLVDNLPM
jgi:8-oxo-dGTP diphosphatase